MADRQPLIAGNWKMNGSRDSNAALLNGIVAGAPAGNVELLVCPPYPYLADVAETLQASDIQLGAQSVSEHAQGAYTGEVEASMLVDLGVSYVIVGHSERRSLFGEGDAAIAGKFLAAVKAGLKPILCVGETLEEREADETDSVVTRQIEAVIGRCGVKAFKDAVVAYEPVWAIGTGRTATPEMAEDVHALIRKRIESEDRSIGAAIRILYGGSMKPANAAGLLEMPDIDGGLIGGASLAAEDFLGIAAAAVA